MKSPLWLLNTMLALLLLIFFLVIIVVRPHKPARTQLIPTLQQFMQPESMPHIDPSLIYKNDLFATYQIAPVLTQTEVDQKLAAVPPPPTLKVAQLLQKTAPQFLAPLAVSLKGIMYSSNEQDNRAIIADTSSKKESLYKVGDSILDAEIIYIGSNKVIFIRSNGQQETLFVTQDDAQEDPIYTQKESWGSVVKRVADQEFTVFYEPFITRVQNLAQFIDMLDITTSFQKGKIVGCRIGKFPQNSVGPLLGLQQGDVLTSINNIPTTTTTNRVAIYQALKNLHQNDVIVVQIMRQGSPTTLRYTIAHVEQPQEPDATVANIGSEPNNPLATKQTDTQETPAHTFTNTIDQVPNYAPMVQTIQKRDQAAMLSSGGRHAMISRREV